MFGVKKRPPMTRKQSMQFVGVLAVFCIPITVVIIFFGGEISDDHLSTIAAINLLIAVSVGWWITKKWIYKE